MSQFSWVTLHVKDLKESVDFYRTHVGLEPYQDFELPDGTQIAFLKGESSTAVELIARPDAKPFQGSGISMGFEVDSLNGKMEELQKAGVSIHSGPFHPNPSVGFFFVLDPNGMMIQFVNHA